MKSFKAAISVFNIRSCSRSVDAICLESNIEYEIIQIDATESPIERPKNRKRNNKRIKKRNNKQKRYYSGKKKRHTMKTQVVVDKSSRKIICTAFSFGKCHDFKLFKESKTYIHPNVQVQTDTGETKETVIFIVLET